jgi:hypothetical protein
MTEKIVATFATTTAALLAESLCRQKGVAGRLIPVPVSIRADCGLAWAMPPAARPDFEAAVAGRLTPAGFYACLLY